MKRFYLVLLFALSTCAAKGNQLSYKDDFDASSKTGLIVLGVQLDYEGTPNKFYAPPVLNWRQYDFETSEAGKKAIKISTSDHHLPKKLRQKGGPWDSKYSPYFIFELEPGDYFLESFNNEYFVTQMGDYVSRTVMSYERTPVVTVEPGRIIYAGELRTVLADIHHKGSHIGALSKLKFVEPDEVAANAYLSKLQNISGTASLRPPKFLSFDCGRDRIDSRGTCKSKKIVITSPPTLE